VTIGLQGQASAEDLEDRQIVRRFLDHDFPTPGRAVLTVKGRPSFVSQDGLDALNPQRGTTAVHHGLKHLLHASAALKEQVAAVFTLIDGVLVVKFAPLLLLPTKRETEAGLLWRCPARFGFGRVVQPPGPPPALAPLGAPVYVRPLWKHLSAL
jgi:hypothetical protein